MKFMRLHKFCELCSKPITIVNKLQFDNGELIKEYKCGHLFLSPQLTQRRFEFGELDLLSVNKSKTAYEYQKEGVEFLMQGSGLLADQMGLGKTIQVLLAIKNKQDKTLFIVRSSTLWQWLNEFKEWVDPTPLGIFMIRSSKDFVPPGFATYLISMDTFGRGNPHLKSLGIKTIVVDECQSFKDQAAKRSRALIEFVEENNIERKIFLSGTPIKNRADEYFTTLNLLDPEEFSSIEKFRRKWLIQDNKGRWSNINPYVEDDFREHISQYVLRRETKDVMKDLPPFRRTFETICIEDENLKSAYNKEAEKLQNIVDAKSKINFFDVQDSLMTLRRITGMAKVDFAVEYIETFLNTLDHDELNPDEKIAIGIHHKAVRDMLFYKLSELGLNPLKLSGEDNSDDKERIKKEFQKPENRILIINMLAGGVGMDGLQCCSNILCLERQWNSADEEQFEGRFHRNGQKNPVLAEYMIAKNTVDDYFCALVERKREIFGQVVSNSYNLASNENMLEELVERTAMSRL